MTTEKVTENGVIGRIELGVKAGCHYCDAWLEKEFSFRLATSTAAAVCLRQKCMAMMYSEPRI